MNNEGKGRVEICMLQTQLKNEKNFENSQSKSQIYSLHCYAANAKLVSKLNEKNVFEVVVDIECNQHCSLENSTANQREPDHHCSFLLCDQREKCCLDYSQQCNIYSGAVRASLRAREINQSSCRDKREKCCLD